MTDPRRQTDAPAETLHVLRPSGPRRAFAAFTQGGLGVLILLIAATTPAMALGWRLALIAFGVLVTTLAWRGWQRSEMPLVLRVDGLWHGEDTPVAPLDMVASVDRSLFAFKPSNGFVLRLREPLGRAWVPGLWWRIGRRVGVGGVTRGADTKIAADALSMLVAQRDRDAGAP
jgi:hypothetical protein